MFVRERSGGSKGWCACVSVCVGVWVGGWVGGCVRVCVCVSACGLGARLQSSSRASVSIDARSAWWHTSLTPRACASKPYYALTMA